MMLPRAKEMRFLCLFSSANYEHLMMVRGFSDKKFRAIRERVTVE